MNKIQTRTATFLLLFQAEFQDAEELLSNGTEVLLEEEIETKFPEEDLPAIRDRVDDILTHIPELDEAVNAVAEGWKTNRMAKVDLTLIRLALYEMKYDGTDAALAINEAVELAKVYGSDKSSSFVNGILAKLK